jgi:hypothetical protein
MWACFSGHAQNGGYMDLDGIIRDLLNERNRVDRIIRTLEQQESEGTSEPRPKSRRGRKSMDSAARQEVSERMRLYWAKQRERRAANGPQAGLPAAGQQDSKPRVREASVSLAGPDCGERVTHAASGSIH